MKKAHINRGFTLLEIMVSIFIIALVLVSVFKIQSSTIRLSVAGEFYSTASHLARQKMADIEQTLRDPSILNELSSDLLAGGFGEDFSGYRWQCVITDFNLEGSQIPEEAIAKNRLKQLKNITIEILYNDEYSFKVTSWRFIQND